MYTIVGFWNPLRNKYKGVRREIRWEERPWDTTLKIVETGNVWDLRQRNWVPLRIRNKIKKEDLEPDLKERSLIRPRQHPERSKQREENIYWWDTTNNKSQTIDNKVYKKKTTRSTNSVLLFRVKTNFRQVDMAKTLLNIIEEGIHLFKQTSL